MKRAPRNFTLLEVMLVVTLLGLLAGYALRGVLSSSASPKHVLRQLASIDAEARLMARQHGPVVLTVEHNEHDLSSAVILDANDKQRRYDIGVLIDVARSTESFTQINIDRHGQSDDYQVTVGDAPHVLHIAGLTGWSWINDE